MEDKEELTEEVEVLLKRKGEGFSLERFLEKNKLVVTFFLLGVLLLGAGLVGVRVWDYFGETEVEVLGEDLVGKESGEKIVVEIAGAVMRPGVYELQIGSRVNDLLTQAGGLTAEADREWVSRNVNLAQRLTDGAKVFIPKVSEAKGLESTSLGAKTGNLVNINTASEGELESLWGVGPATAKKIVEGRPYQRIEELLERKIIKSNVWEEIKGEISVW